MTADGDLLSLLVAAKAAGLGWYGMAAACVVVAIRILRLDAVQSMLPVLWRWQVLKPWAQLAIVGVGALGASWVAGLVAGNAPLAALGAAVPVALAAIGGHEMTRAAGYAQTAAELARNPGYQPSGLRSALDPLLPVDRDRLMRVGPSLVSKVRPDAHEPGNGAL